MSQTPYAKPFLDEAQQVALLGSRGLSVSDPLAAAEFLKRVNYYRLSGYAIPFLLDREHFKPGASFADLITVYRFDRILRDLLFEALEAAELAYRTIAQSTRRQAQGTRHKAPSTRHKAQSTKHQAQGTKHKAQIPRLALDARARNLLNYSRSRNWDHLDAGESPRVGGGERSSSPSHS